MTTPDDDTTRRIDPQTTPTDSEAAPTDPRTMSPGSVSPSDRPEPTSQRTIPGRVPSTEEAGAPMVPQVAADRPATAGRPDDRPATRTPDPRSGSRPATRPPSDDERDAPLVPDLRPTDRRRTDGGTR